MWPITLFFERLFGAKYILNHRSAEVHRINDLTRSCWVHQIRHYSLIWRRKTLTELQRQDPEINGCIHCFKAFNTD